MTADAQGLWARVLARALVVVTAGVMALGFLGIEAALLVAFLTTLTYVLLWLRTRFAGFLFVAPERDDHGDPAGEPDETDGPEPGARGSRPRKPPVPRAPNDPRRPPRPRRPSDEN